MQEDKKIVATYLYEYMMINSLATYKHLYDNIFSPSNINYERVKCMAGPQICLDVSLRSPYSQNAYLAP